MTSSSKIMKALSYTAAGCLTGICVGIYEVVNEIKVSSLEHAASRILAGAALGASAALWDYATEPNARTPDTQPYRRAENTAARAA